MKRVKTGTRGSGPKNKASSKRMTGSSVTKKSPKTMKGVSGKKVIIGKAKAINKYMSEPTGLQKWATRIGNSIDDYETGKTIKAVEKGVAGDPLGKLLRKIQKRRESIR